MSEPSQSRLDALADAETLRLVHDGTRAMGVCRSGRYDTQNWGSECCGIVEAQKHGADTGFLVNEPTVYLFLTHSERAGWAKVCGDHAAQSAHHAFRAVPGLRGPA